MIIRCIYICIDSSLIIINIKKKAYFFIFFVIEKSWFWKVNMVDAIYININ